MINKAKMPSREMYKKFRGGVRGVIFINKY